MPILDPPVPAPRYRDFVWTLWQYDRRRCLKAVALGGLLWASAILVPISGAMGGIYLGAPLTLGWVALAAVVILASGAWREWVNRRQPWQTGFDKALRLYQTSNPRMSASVLVAPEDGRRTAVLLMHNRLYPASRRLGGNPPPHSPHLTCQITAMEPQAFSRSASAEKFHNRIVRLLIAAGIDGMVGRIRIEGGRVLDEDKSLVGASSR